MSVVLAPQPVFQGIGFGGLPLPGGKLFTYQAGTTSPQATFTDSTGLVQNTNPIILNANGQANVWLSQVTYKFVLQDNNGNPIWSVDNILGGVPLTIGLIISVINSTVTQSFIGAILYPQTVAEAGITIVNPWFAPGVIDRYGTNTIPGITDMLGAINFAIQQNNQVGGAPVIALGGTYFHSAVITMRWNVSIRGSGKDTTIFQSSHTGAGIKTTGTVNAPSGGVTEIRDCRFVNTNSSNVDGGIVDLTGTEIIIRNVSVSGFAYSVIFDQTELGDIDLCDFSNFITAGIWLVNGNDYAGWPLASAGFTNRISIRRCQINGGLGGVATGFGIIDDGGAVHTFQDNNLNLCTSHYRLAATNILRIATSEHESSSGDNIKFFTTTSVNATPVGPNNNVVLDGGLWSPTGVIANLNSAVVCITVINVRSITNTPAITSSSTANTIIAYGNQDSGTGQLFDGLAAAVHFEVEVAGSTNRFKNTNNAFTGAMGFYGTTPTGQNTGWGIPTGATTLSNFAGGSATLAQTSGVVAEIITALKNLGLFGA